MFAENLDTLLLQFLNILHKLSRINILQLIDNQVYSTIKSNETDRTFRTILDLISVNNGIQEVVV